MHPFDPADHPAGLTELQRAAAGRLAEGALPSWELEEWRYSPIGDLDLASFEPAAEPGEFDLAAIKASYPTPNLVVTSDGHVVHSEGAVEVVAGVDESVVGANGDLFADVNCVFAPATIRVVVKEGAMVAEDIVIVHHIQAQGIAVFPRLTIDAGPASAVKVIEVWRSADVEALVVPHVEVRCGATANVGYVSDQQFGPRVWQVGSQISEVGQQATFRSALAAFGGSYARIRSDCRLEGRGAHGDLDAVYFGSDDQVLDFRTFQDHNAPDTTSNLLFKGVVDDASRAIYTGLIRVSEDAPGTSAFQTNRNIKLGEDSWAESVPNLEIETDDVRCSHASTVGPIDEEHRFYLETRGVPPEVADRLIVSGFFDEVLVELPSMVVEPAVREAIDAKLGAQ